MPDRVRCHGEDMILLHDLMFGSYLIESDLYGL